MLWSVSSSALALGSGDSTIIVTASTMQQSGGVDSTLAFIFGGSALTGIKQKTSSNILQAINYATQIDTAFTVPENGKVFTAALKRTSGYVQMYMNGAADTQRALATESITGNAFLMLGQASATAWKGSIHRALVFNYALSDDKIKRYSAGAKLDWEDVGGSGELFSSQWYDIGGSFESGFSSSGATAFQGNNTAATAGAFQTIDLVEGKVYRLIVTTNFTGNVIVDAYLNGSFGGNYTTVACTTGVPTVITFTANRPNTNRIVVFGDATGSPITFTNISFRQLGAVLDLEPENITEGTWFDASPNGLHGTVTGALANRSMPSYSSRNYIINGGMDFWQRGVGASADGGYALDRFFLNHNCTTVSSYQAARTGLGGNSLVLYIPARGAGTVAIVSQPFETANVQPLAGKVMTLSFRVGRGSYTTGNLTFGVVTGTGVNEKFPTGGSTIIKSVPLASIADENTSYTQLSITFVVPAGTNSMRTIIGMYDGSWVDQTAISVKNVMLNEGPVAAPFERAGGTIGGELALCQRYCQRLVEQATGSVFIPMGIIQPNDIYFTPVLPVEMRIRPSLSTAQTPTEVNDYNVLDINASAVSGFALTVDLFGSTTMPRFKLTKTSHGLTAYHVLKIASNKVILDAEI